MLQIRITNFDGSNPIILDRAEDRVYSKTINSADEGISFKIAKNSDKAEVLNPDNGGYTKFWEVWETATNTKLNYGPITSITEQDTYWNVVGAGCSALLNDYIKSKKTFYTSIASIVDDLRFENLSIQPRTSTLVHDEEVTTDQTTVFGAVTVDERYSGLSKNTKDNVIDELVGVEELLSKNPKTYIVTDSFWSGMSKKDSLIVDLGATYDITKLRILPAWWGGDQRLNNRAYDFEVHYADDTELPITTLRGKEFGPFHEIFDTGDDNRVVAGPNIYIGYAASGTGVDTPVYYQLQEQEGPINARYIRVRIKDTHAWYSSSTDVSDTAVIDGWDYQCDPDYVAGTYPDAFINSSSEGVMEDKEIDDRSLKPSNDCHASLVEVEAFKEIFPPHLVYPLALQRIDNNNLQITYSHTPDSSETVTTDNGFRKFEPGTLFRRATVTYSGANTSYTKFFDSDCSGCYSSFNFGILDQYNNLLYRTTSTSGTVSRTFGVYTKHLLIKGASNAVVTSVDAWLGKSDPFSWGGSYSYTETQDDFAVVHFRGQSFNWYASVPADKTGATVSIEIRSKAADNNWGAYSTLEAALELPNDISSEIVYSISYESGILQPETVYEIKITNLDGGYCSIDSIEGYWSGSFTMYNEDSDRIFLNRPERFTQIYDSRFSAGSMYKWNQDRTRANINFTGDRAIILSAKGRNHGTVKMWLHKIADNGVRYGDFSTNAITAIPGGESDGSLLIDLDTGSAGNEITQAVVFDSNDYFTDGLPWGKYQINFGLELGYEEVYTTTTGDMDGDSFVKRCKDCDGSLGESIQVNKFVYLDAIGVHEQVGLSVDFQNETHLEMLKAVAEVIQAEWEVSPNGIRVEPRIGTDTNVVLREGHNTLVDWQITNDITKVSSILFTTGADIDGLPLFTITEDKRNRELLGRTVMRHYDNRNMASYDQLIGLSRTELKKRRLPEKRILVSHVGDIELEGGDSYILYTKKAGPIRVRIIRKEQNETSGKVYNLECITWPQII